MRVIQVEHKRVRNLGNYESASVTLTAEVAEGEDEMQVLETLRLKAKRFLFEKRTPNAST